jgi:hypothetical protein
MRAKSPVVCRIALSARLAAYFRLADLGASYSLLPRARPSRILRGCCASGLLRHWLIGQLGNLVPLQVGSALSDLFWPDTEQPQSAFPASRLLLQVSNRQGLV